MQVSTRICGSVEEREGGWTFTLYLLIEGHEDCVTMVPENAFASREDAEEAILVAGRELQQRLVDSIGPKNILSYYNFGLIGQDRREEVKMLPISTSMAHC